MQFFNILSAPITKSSGAIELCRTCRGAFEPFAVLSTWCNAPRWVKTHRDSRLAAGPWPASSSHVTKRAEIVVAGSWPTTSEHTDSLATALHSPRVQLSKERQQEFDHIGLWFHRENNEVLLLLVDRRLGDSLQADLLTCLQING
jgi:hypothetical protein